MMEETFIGDFYAECTSEQNATSGYCPQTSDGVICWPSTQLNATVALPCPRYLQSLMGGTYENQTARRRCSANAMWGSADYTACLSFISAMDISSATSTTHLFSMYRIYWIGYCTSLAFLLLALSVFLHYRSLWCLRNIIHSNLILCFALHNITWIVSTLVVYELIIKHLLFEKVKFCFIMTVLFRYFITAGFFWMLVEGLYLLMSVCFTFQAHKIKYWMCALLGWGLPILLVGGSSILRVQKSVEYECWDELATSDYIFLGPIVVALLINFVVLITVLRILMTKLKGTVQGEMKKFKKVAKAMFVLCPLLGTNYIIAVIPVTQPMWLHVTVSYYVTIMTSFQGLIVAVLFCFTNNEVLFSLKKTFAQTIDEWESRRGSSSYTKLFASFSETRELPL